MKSTECSTVSVRMIVPSGLKLELLFFFLPAVLPFHWRNVYLALLNV